MLGETELCRPPTCLRSTRRATARPIGRSPPFHDHTQTTDSPSCKDARRQPASGDTAISDAARLSVCADCAAIPDASMLPTVSRFRRCLPPLTWRKREGSICGAVVALHGAHQRRDRREHSTIPGLHIMTPLHQSPPPHCTHLVPLGALSGSEHPSIVRLNE